MGFLLTLIFRGKQMSKNIFVYADWESISKPTLIGILNADLLRGKEIFSFEYDSQWLKNQQFFLDPEFNAL